MGWLSTLGRVKFLRSSGRRMTNHRDTLLRIVAELTGSDATALEGLWSSPLADAGLDSIRQQELLAELEDQFGVEISPEDAVHLETLKAIERYMKGLAR